MKMRKFFCAALILCLMLALSVGASADEIDSGSCGSYVDWELDEDGELSISGEGKMEAYTSYTSVPWHSYRDRITDVDIDEDVTYISNYAFYDCTNLTSVDMPINIEKVGDYVFWGCTSLEKVTFYGNAPTFQQRFEAYHNFTDVNAVIYYPAGNATWTSSVMKDYGGDLTWKSYDPATVVLEDGDCGENVTWSLRGDGVLTISGTGAMEDFPTWREVDWGSYRDYIFQVVIEKGVTTVGDEAFNSCDKMTKVAIPSTVKSIGEGAFTACKKLTSVEIPSGVIAIGDFAFSRCSSLSGITLPKNLTAMGRFVLNDTAITSITIPAGVTEIAEASFVNCASLKKVIFQEGLVKIGDDTFNGCTALTSVTIPATVTHIGYQAFYGCSDLSEIWFRGNAPAVSEYAFSDVSATAYYPDNSTWTSSVRDSFSGDLTWVAYDPVTGLTAPVVKGSNVASSGKVRLTWNEVDGAVSYKVYRSTSKSSGYKLMKTVTGATSYTNTTAEPNTTYYYYVVAVNADGARSPKSSIVTRTCDCARPVVTVSNVASTGKIRLTWEKVEGAVKYQVYRSTSKNGTYTLLKTVTGTTFTNSSAVAGETYYYKVVAVGEKNAATSAASSIKARTCDCAQPDVSITRKSGKPRLTWEKVDGAVKYKVYRSTSGKDGSWSLLKTITGTSFTNTSAKSGRTYYYKVIAIAEESAANSAYSEVVSIKSK